ncbi:MAG: RecX family transcriptional regulator [Anaerolineaceae bacterium]
MEKEITAIEAQKRNHNRLNISLDGEYAFSLDRLTAAWLNPGKKLSEAEIERLLAQDELESVYARVLHFLGFRARSAQELEKFLQQKGCDNRVTLAVITRLEQNGYLDDVRFSQDWVENRCTFRPRSQSLLKAELHQKGVSDPIIQATLEKAALDDAQLAYQAGCKVADRYARQPWEGFRNKLSNYLLRRGFSYQIAKEITHQLWIEVQNREHNNATTTNMEHLTQ